MTVYDKKGHPHGQLHGHFISSVNSTTSLLGSGGTFLGISEDVSEFTTITVSILGTLATATATLYFEVSSDNSIWSQVPRKITNITADVPHVFLIAEQYFRVRYTNDSIAQTGSFRIQTVYANARPMTLAHTVENELSINSDVVLSRMVSNIDLDMARKLMTGQRAFFFFGYNDNVFDGGTGAWEDIHPNGGDINWQTTPSTIAVSSSHAADTAAGLGCRSVEVHGLSATGVDQDEVIVLNGTTEVTSALTYIRVNKMHNETVGTYGGSHRGDITCRVSSGGAKTGDILAVMTGTEGAVDSSVQYGSGEAGNGYWSVPLAKVAYVTNLNVDIDNTSGKTADVVLYEREGILNTSAPFDSRRVIWLAREAVGEVKKTFKSHIKIKGLTDIFFRATAEQEFTKISVSLDFYLLDANAAGE